jgi:hypothetical protein
MLLLSGIFPGPERPRPRTWALNGCVKQTQPAPAGGIAVDAAHKVYVAGIVDGTPRLYKYDEQGNILWMKKVAEQTSPGGVAELSAVQTDQFGNVFVTGHFNNTILLNEQQDSLIANGTLATSLNGFIAKYDTAGNFRWAKLLGSGARQAMPVMLP